MKRKAFLASLILILILLSLQWSGLAAATVGHRPNTAYQFVEIETTVHRAGVETSSENPNERRWYISNVIVQPEDVPTYSLIKQKFMPYFSRNVMDPAEKRKTKRRNLVRKLCDASRSRRRTQQCDRIS